MTVIIKKLFICKKCGTGFSAHKIPAVCTICNCKFKSGTISKKSFFWPKAPSRQVKDFTELEIENALQTNENKKSTSELKLNIHRENESEYLKFLLDTDEDSMTEILKSILDLYAVSHGLKDKNLIARLIMHGQQIELQVKKLEAMINAGSSIVDYKTLYSPAKKKD